MHTNNWLHVSYQMTDWLSVYCFAFWIFWERRQPTAEWKLKKRRKKQSMCCALFVSIGFFLSLQVYSNLDLFSTPYTIVASKPSSTKKMCATDFKHFLIGLNINKICSKTYCGEKDRKNKPKRKNVRVARFCFGFEKRRKKKQNKYANAARTSNRWEQLLQLYETQVVIWNCTQFQWSVVQTMTHTKWTRTDGKRCVVYFWMEPQTGTTFILAIIVLADQHTLFFFIDHILVL